MTDDKEAFEYFNRLDELYDFDEFAFTSKDSFLDAYNNLTGEKPSAKQLDALFSAGSTSKLDFFSKGINRIEFTVNGRQQIRFTLPNKRGLFGITKAIGFLKGVFS